MAYNGKTDMISGIRQKNGQDFPLVDASAVYVDNGTQAGTRLDDELNNIKNNGGTAIKNMLADSFSTSIAYNVGDLVIYDNKLYQFTVDHAAGAWTGTDAEQVALADIIESYNYSVVDDGEGNLTFNLTI